MICLQIFGAFAMGVLFAAVYLRTGNILPSMFAHTLNDVLVFCIVSQTSNGILTGHLSAANIPDVIIMLLYFVIGLRLIRPEKRPEILSTFAERWAGEAELRRTEY